VRFERLRIRTLVAIFTTIALALGAPVLTSAAQAASVSAVSKDSSSFFAESYPELVGSGWSSCSSQVTWSLDQGTMSDRIAQAEQARLDKAFRTWSLQTGISFTFSGFDQRDYDPKTHQLRAETVAAAPNGNRHIAVAFLSSSDSPLLTTRTLGFGMPSMVYPGAREITEGVLVIKSEILNASSTFTAKARMSLYLHEIGHILGLGHSKDKSSIMFPIITGTVNLHQADVSNVRSFIRPCQADAGVAVTSTFS
jgi:predicted Zn-dependent protease